MSCLTGKLAAAAVADPALRGVLQDMTCATDSLQEDVATLETDVTVLQAASVFGSGYGTGALVAVPDGAKFRISTTQAVSGGVLIDPLGDITLPEAGMYEVEWKITGTGLAAGVAAALYLDGTFIPGTAFYSDPAAVGDAQEVSGQAIVTVTAGSLLTLRNATGAALTLPALTIGAIPMSNIAVHVQKLPTP